MLISGYRTWNIQQRDNHFRPCSIVFHLSSQIGTHTGPGNFDRLHLVQRFDVHRLQHVQHLDRFTVKWLGSHQLRHYFWRCFPGRFQIFVIVRKVWIQRFVLYDYMWNTSQVLHRITLKFQPLLCTMLHVLVSQTLATTAYCAILTFLKHVYRQHSTWKYVASTL